MIFFLLKKKYWCDIMINICFVLSYCLCKISLNLRGTQNMSELTLKFTVWVDPEPSSDNIFHVEPSPSPPRISNFPSSQALKARHEKLELQAGQADRYSLFQINPSFHSQLLWSMIFALGPLDCCWSHYKPVFSRSTYLATSRLQDSH